MGFSLVAAAAIVGVSLVMGLEIIVGTTIPTITNINESYNEMRNRAIDQVQTNINITSVTSEINGSNYDINITVENVGSVTLEPTYFNILINGIKNEFTCSKTFLYPENEVYFNVLNISGSGECRLKIVTNNGISDYYMFILT
jgi:archaellum component FlaF (FlaF/FlaG flagellin family)